MLPRSRKIFNAADFLEALIAKSTQNASVRKIAIRFNKKFLYQFYCLGEKSEAMFWLIGVFDEDKRLVFDANDPHLQ